MSFYDHTVNTFQSLVVNCFKNGYIQIKTKMVDKLFDTIIPQLEERLETKLELEAGAREEYAPSMVEYLSKRDQFVQHLRRKSFADDDIIQGRENLDIYRQNKLKLFRSVFQVCLSLLFIFLHTNTYKAPRNLWMIPY